jgi:hypothetical protein
MITKHCGCSTETCGCCEGIEKLTPADTANRPGLPALRYRVGTHGTFFETMKARLSNLAVEAPGADGQTLQTYYPLARLTTRDPGDPAIALLDSWAIVADVLTFYQERIANEGYLRTATERRSILELARLVGYTLRPGVASTVYLAYTLEEDLLAKPPKATAVTIPAGARVQSVPGPGELPQAFETSDDLPARSEWNNLQVRLTQPQNFGGDAIAPGIHRIYFEGIGTGLKPNDPILFLFDNLRVLRWVDTIETQAPLDRTKVMLQGGQMNPAGQPAPSASTAYSQHTTEPKSAPNELDNLVKHLQVAPIPQRANALQLERFASDTFKAEANTAPRFLETINPLLKGNLYRAWGQAKVTGNSTLQCVGALRVPAKLFGHNAPNQLEPLQNNEGANNQAFTISASPNIGNMWRDAGVSDDTGDLDKLALDSDYKIKPGEWVAVSRRVVEDDEIMGAPVLSFHRVKTVEPISMAGLGLTSRVTLLTLETPWLPESEDGRLESTALLRTTTVYVQFEELPLAEEPIETCVGHSEKQRTHHQETEDEPDEISEDERRIELRDLYDDLAPGRWLIVSGERADVKDADGEIIPGVMASELVMAANIEQTYREDLPNEKKHTTLILDRALAYCYKRETVVIYGNVVKATHGETRHEPLGAGDGSQAWQTFALKQPPLTFVPAPTPQGVESTLHVYVDNIEWHETDSLAGLGPGDRRFITKTDDDAITAVVFGNGINGARLPTGLDNVNAVYRNGIGRAGNVKAGQISLLQTKPLGVKSVINPLRASGGSDKEDRDQARENAPLAVASLDRLVGLQDYIDFSRTFAGIAKADARRLSDGRRQLVHVTIAGADDIPIDPVSDLYRNLVAALQKYGDEDLAVQVDLRELVVLMLSARVRVAPDYLWEPVAQAVRATLLDTFGFRRRSLGQPALLCEVIGAIQSVEGVGYVDVDAFGGIPEKTAGVDTKGAPTGERALLTSTQLTALGQAIFNPTTGQGLVPIGPARRVEADVAGFDNRSLRPAQLAIFTPEVPDTLILNQII